MKIPGRTAYIIGGAIVLLILFGNSGFRRLVRRYWEINKLQGMIVQLKKENVLLRKEVYLLEKDPSYIEHIARRELGFVARGEVEYRFKK
ncbi:MAG TPA: hypothetical protein DEE98_04720 [Elusimicrobia bacterium]|nr:MAG: hypothetical protein A2278_04405 [Elusimicrobia bacterium RIFOXYA12_FULL_49_49]OGS10485.1 MAG: hypothetical protein A2386_05260 [Elusimicrobia bacterium RIFOXYB1_FULL_48_9]OGS14708.1 MAG: hypothetical protein A2251_09435 [Elusimicrobia bacterium RIFOXYA2_FULL_47_53]OGS25640.1 MAG: hypothetical protein A2339_06155 [Elusimicrobia bacterium RIFOXYB12_FULL_50_12]OGS31799.1 MAG: hypothetical protein A2323_06345 [Elusimicrobia bacterium RIFOXYB2_FULL_46_23]HBU69668.1 hypothetical protein [El